MQQGGRPISARRLTPREQERRRRQRLRARRRRLWLAFAGLAAAALVLWLVPRWQEQQRRKNAPQEVWPSAAQARTAVRETAAPKPLLVNGNVPLPIGYAPALEQVGQTGIWMEAEAAQAAAQLLEAAEQAGIRLVPLTGYLNEDERRSAYTARLEAYLKAGEREAEAIRKTAQIVSEPQYSELGTGLALELLAADYPAKDVGFAETEAYAWLEANAARFGFILRYPKPRQASTGMAFMPWHWRYVGTEIAQQIMESTLCLEEYLALCELN